jgi:hypothetical protein
MSSPWRPHCAPGKKILCPPGASLCSASFRKPPLACSNLQLSTAATRGLLGSAQATLTKQNQELRVHLHVFLPSHSNRRGRDGRDHEAQVSTARQCFPAHRNAMHAGCSGALRTDLLCPPVTQPCLRVWDYHPDSLVPSRT